jgi:hypothetical protein
MTAAIQPLARRLAIVATGLLLVLTAWNLTILIPYLVSQQYAIGVDYRFFVESAQRWLAGSEMYFPEQITGPWTIVPDLHFLYPPIAIYLFIPFIWLPAIFWWAIPVAMSAYALWRLRPAWWTWPFLAFVLWYPRTESMFFFGSTTLWVLGLLSLGAVHPWAVPLILFKPSLAPFALFRINTRQWWLGLAIVVIASATVIVPWVEYVLAMRNVTESALFGLQEIPILLAPIVAWLGRARPVGAEQPAQPAPQRDRVPTQVVGQPLP